MERPPDGLESRTMSEKDSVSFTIDSFNWPRAEAVSSRYGSFELTEDIHKKLVNIFEGKQVKVTAEVTQVTSPGIYYTDTKVGELHTIGVGLLRIEDPGYNDVTAACIEPGDGREGLWLEPYTLNRLHKQQVRITIKETDEPDTPFPFWSMDGSDQPEPEWFKEVRMEDDDGEQREVQATQEGQAEETQG